MRSILTARPAKRTAALSVDEGGDCGCGVGLLAGEYVAVDVECERDGRMAEALGSHADVRAGGEEMRCVRVPQVVQSNAERPDRSTSRANARVITSGCQPRPSVIENTSPLSTQPGPPRSRSSSWCLRCARSTFTVTGSRSMTRRERVDFTSPTDGS